MCTKVWNPERRTVTQNLAILGDRVASPLDAAALAALTERAVEEGLLPVFHHTVPVAVVDATGTAVAVEHREACDWCESAATLVVMEDGESLEDYACGACFTRWFGSPGADGESFTVKSLDGSAVAEYVAYCGATFTDPVARNIHQSGHCV